MRLPLLELPEDPAAWPAWLEAQLVGPDLGELVDELLLVLEPAGAEPTLEAIAGDELPAALERGLSALSAARIRRLLKHPRRLLDLQERVFVEGGEYWTRLIEADAGVNEADGWERLAVHLDRPPAAAKELLTARRRWTAAAATLAAALLVGVGLWLGQPGPPAWGWNRPDVFAARLGGDAYLEHLADAADEWFARPKGTAPQLERDLADFRRSCDRLIEAPHPQLAEADRDWLRQRCRAWSGKFDGHLADLKAGGKPVDAVRAEADETVRKLATALRGRLS